MIERSILFDSVKSLFISLQCLLFCGYSGILSGSVAGKIHHKQLPSFRIDLTLIQNLRQFADWNTTQSSYLETRLSAYPTLSCAPYLSACRGRVPSRSDFIHVKLSVGAFSDVIGCGPWNLAPNQRYAHRNCLKEKNLNARCLIGCQDGYRFPGRRKRYRRVRCVEDPLTGAASWYPPSISPCQGGRE